MNRETKRMMQRQGQMEADGSPAARKPPPGGGRGSGAAAGKGRPAAGGRTRQRTTVPQYFREVREEMRQVAWPSRSELFNYTGVVVTTLALMIGLIYALNYGLAHGITFLFSK